MNQDHNQVFPNQIIDGNQTECVALTVADICGNIDSELYDPDILYAYTLRLMNQWPNTGGLDPYTGMLTPIVYGNLPVSLETFTAKTVGELYVANWQNYTPYQRIMAQQHTKRGVKRLYSFSDITNYLDTYRCGVSLAVKWYQSFNSPAADGTLPPPTGEFSYHNVAVYDDPFGYLLIKPWLGATYGQGGYARMPQATFNQVFISAAGFDPNAWRWGNLVQIALTHPQSIPDILPLLKTA